MDQPKKIRHLLLFLVLLFNGTRKTAGESVSQFGLGVSMLAPRPVGRGFETCVR